MSTARPETDPAALQRRPRAAAFRVEDLVADVLAGRVRVPGWQRPIAWDVEDVRKLLDSLYRGYPVGTLLLWKRAAPAERVVFGGVEILAAERTDALYVVDGQQRITSLVRVLAGGSDPDEPFALYFDVAAGEVKRAPRGSPPASWVPFTSVLDARDQLRWMMAHPDVDQDRVLDLGRRIREYEIPAYVVESDDEGVVREIFQRVNATGKSLDVHDVFDGRFRGVDDVHPAGLRDVAEDVARFGFGRISEKQLHGMMLATRTTDITRDLTRRWSPQEARAALDDLQRAARRVVQFLMTRASIPHVDLLPYGQPLVALSRFFHAHPEPSHRNLELLSRWVWRGAAAGLHTGAVVHTRATLSAIDAREDASVQRLLESVAEGRSTPFDPQASHFNFRWARSRICALCLAANGPRHLETHAPLRGDELTPQALVRGSASLGNRILHPPLPDLRGAVRTTPAAVLASHEITPDEAELFRAGDTERFVAEREARLDARVRDFVARRTQWEASDRPPLRALWEDDDEDDDG